MADKNQPHQQLEIQATPESQHGQYSNLANLGHSREEFLIDFILQVGDHGTLQSRIILSPGHMKRLVMAMQNQVKKYEAEFGEISVGEPQTINPAAEA